MVVKRQRLERPGFAIIELMAAMALTATLILVALTGMSAIGRMDRSLVLRQIARHELENRLELITSLPWDEITTDRIEKLPFTESALAPLGKAKVTGTVALDERTAMKRITLEIADGDLSHPRFARMRLSAWVARQRGPR